MADTLGLAVNIGTVVDLFIKVGVLCSMYCAHVKTAPRDVRSILNEADQFRATLKNLEQLLDGPNSSKVQTSENIHRLITECDLLLHDLVEKLELGTTYQRLKWPLKKEDVAEMVRKLERHRSAISLQLQIHQSSLILDVQSDIVLSKLRAVQGEAFDSHAEAENAKCLPGTRVDILQQVKQWANNPDSKSIFWLNRMAGTGKSTISRTVCETLAGKGMLGASFFFKRGEGDRGRATYFFTTIATQLVQQLPSLIPHVRGTVKEDASINDKSPMEQFNKLIAGPMGKLPRHQQPPILVLVADALDECADPGQIRQIIHLLSRVKSFKSVCIRVLLTSRPELPTRLGFRDISGDYSDLVLHEIPMPIIEKDIAAFLDHQLALIREDYNKSVSPVRQLGSSWPGKDHIATLVQMAIPLFIFAATICRFIQDRRLGGPTGQLTKVLEQHERHMSNLDLTYLPVLAQLLSGLTTSQQHGIIQKFKNIIGSVVTLSRPLSTVSLTRILDTSESDVADLLDFLHSVLHVPPDPTEPIRLLHLSFRDFLVDSEKAKNPEKYPFWVNEQEMHGLLATKCLGLLSKDGTLGRNMCHLREPGVFRSDISDDVINNALPPEVQYACLYWAHHWEESGQQIKDAGIVDQFLRCHLLHWLEALSLMSRISDAVLIIDGLATQVDNNSSVSALVQDMRRIIYTFHSPIEMAPLQVYYSAILFAPMRSIVREIFANQLPDWLFSLPKVDMGWDACLHTMDTAEYIRAEVAFSHDSTLLASIPFPRVVMVWNVKTGICTTIFENLRCFAIAFSHDSNFLALEDEGEIRLLDIHAGTHIRLLNAYECVRNPPEDIETVKLAFSHDSALLAMACCKTIILRTRETGDYVTVNTELVYSVNSMIFSHDSTLLVIGSTSQIILLDVAKSTCMEIITPHISISVTFSPSSYLLAYMHESEDNIYISTWDVSKELLKETRKVKLDLSAQTRFTLSPNLEFVAVMSPGYLKVYVVTSPSDNVDEDVDEDVQFTSVRDIYSASFTRCASLYDDVVKIQNDAGHFIASLDACPNEVFFSEDAKFLALVFPFNTVRIWDIEAEECDQTTSLPAATLSFALRSFFSSHDSKLWAFCGDEELVIWDIATNRSIATFPVKDDTSLIYIKQQIVAFSKDSRLVAFGNKNVLIFDISNETCMRTFEIDQQTYVRAIAFLHDSKLLVSIVSIEDLVRLEPALYGSSLWIWDISSTLVLAKIDFDQEFSWFSFEEVGNSLCTNLGAFALEEAPDSLNTEESTPTQQSFTLQRHGLGIRMANSWVFWNSEPLLWLPQPYRNASVTRDGKRICIMHRRNGKPLFVTVDTASLGHLYR